MNARDETELTPEQVAKYRAELAAMGWPLDEPPACGTMQPAQHFIIEFGVKLLAALDARRAEE